MKYLILTSLFVMNTAFAEAQDYYQFSNAEQQQRFTAMTHQLRCLVCQNQTLAESNAPLASDIRDQIYREIHAGNSDKEIIQDLEDKHGTFISYRPPFDKCTSTLWLAPFIILISGVFFLIRYLLRKSR